MARNPEVIIVDPDLTARADTNRMLGMAGFTVVGAADYGIDSVTVVKEHSADIILVSM